ncbi:hypothetical protein BH24PSE2_BH24PSE2_14810 [soil metagenome]
MRNLFLLLVLANFGLLAWQRWIAPSAERPVEEATLPRLELAGAVEDDDLPAVEEMPVVASSADGTARCISIGPFRNESETAQVLRSLRAAGHTPEQRLAGGEVRLGHRVYLPAFESRSAARRVLDALKAHGVGDFYIVPDGKERNAISLGVFASRELADERAAEISAAGYSPVIRDHYRSGAVYWIDTEIGRGDSLRLEDFEPIARRIMRLETAPCPPSEAQLVAGEG